ncbi:MAG: DUF2892 domain-containing protein [Alphaproteobacteria bacterium]|nr:DUF2892 domain-containing protein [Alphaproteobacteria bacterium]
MFKAANVGSVDRMLRLIAGVILVVLPFVMAIGSPLALYGLPAVGAVLIFTALVRFCPAYTLLGLNTCGRS